MRSGQNLNAIIDADPIPNLHRGMQRNTSPPYEAECANVKIGIIALNLRFSYLRSFRNEGAAQQKRPPILILTQHHSNG